MDEATKYLLTQGVLGVWALVATLGAAWLFRDNRALMQRMIAKSETDAQLNKEAAARMTAVLDAMVAKTRGRRATVAGNE